MAIENQGSGTVDIGKRHFVDENGVQRVDLTNLPPLDMGFYTNRLNTSRTIQPTAELANNQPEPALAR